MKKIVLLATAAAVLASVPATGSAANIKSILNRSQTVTYQGVKLPEGVTMYQNNPKALFAGVYEDARIVPDAMVPSSRFVFFPP
ncbi:MAG: hypothetical protein ACFNON_06475, partial [Veillonella parvula]